jgi:hypothetical protein
VDEQLQEIDDPASLPRPEPVTGTRSFTDPAQPGKQLTLTFRAERDQSRRLRVNRVWSKYLADYVTGRMSADGKTRVRVPLQLAGNPPRPIEADEDLFYEIATMESLQMPADGKKPFDVNQWAALSVVMPTAYQAITAWASELLQGAVASPQDDENPYPNDSGAV